MAGAVLARRLRVTRPEGATSSAPPRLLWKVDDLIRWLLVVGVGAVAVGVSWYICAGDATFSQQIGPADAAIGGVLLAGLGNATWLLRGRRALGERRRALLADVIGADEPATVTRVSGRPAVHEAFAAPDTGALFVAGEGLERFHRADCSLATGRQGWLAMTRSDHERAGRRPCDVCSP